MSAKWTRCETAHGDLFLFNYDLPGEELITELLERAHLSGCEAERFAALKGERRRVEWLAARVIAREQFSSTIDYHSTGQPFLRSELSGVLPSISISHTSGCVVMLASGRAVCGVDIENVERMAVRLSSKFASGPELEIARVVYKHNAELLVWCAKEALYKMAGVEGLDFKSGMLLVGRDGGDALRMRLLGGEPGNKYSETEIVLNFAIYDDFMIVAGSL